MKNKDYLIKDSFILFIASSVVNLSNFAFHMYATRSLGPELYGALVALLGMVIIFSFQSKMIHRPNVFLRKRIYIFLNSKDVF